MSSQSQWTQLQLSSHFKSKVSSGKGRAKDKRWESPERSPLTSDATMRSNLDNRPSSLYFINVSISRVIKCDMCMLKCFNCPRIPSSHRQHVPALCLVTRGLVTFTLSHLLGLRSDTHWNQDSTFRITVNFFECQMDYISLLRNELRNKVTRLSLFARIDCLTVIIRVSVWGSKGMNDSWINIHYIPSILPFSLSQL